MRTETEQRIFSEIKSITKNFKNVKIRILTKANSSDYQTSRCYKEGYCVYIDLAKPSQLVPDYDEWAEVLAKSYTLMEQVKNEYIYDMENPCLTKAVAFYLEGEQAGIFKENK